MVEDTGEPAFRLAHGEELRHSPSASDHRLSWSNRVKAIKRFHERCYGVDSARVFVTLTESTEVIEGSSRYNMANAQAVLDMIVRIVERTILSARTSYESLFPTECKNRSMGMGSTACGPKYQSSY